MSPEAVTADRIHREIKSLIVAGTYVSGLPLTVQSLADEFGTSTSPVRDALNRLVGERLVEMQSGGGFALPAISCRSAYNLYSFHGDLMRTIVKVMVRLDDLGPPPACLVNKTAQGLTLARATSEFFALTAACSPNPEHLDAILQIGERLAVFRLHEGGIGRQGEELATLWNVTRSGNRNATRVAMWQYHRRRLLRVEDIYLCVARSS